MPAAVKLVVSHLGTVALAGLIVILVKAGAVTFKVTLLEFTPLAEAETVVAPTASVDAIPVPFTVATEVLEDAQTTDPDISPKLPSE